MFTHEVKTVVFRGVLQPTKKAEAQEPALVLRRDPPEGLRSTFYSMVVQTVEEVRVVDNAPGVSMWPYLLASAQTQRMNTISIYQEAGSTAEKMRFLYLNDVALALWGEMGKGVEVLGRFRRPPRSAVLAFGMPFSE